MNNGNTPIQLVLTLDVTNLALVALSKLPYEQSAAAIANIREQAEARLREHNAFVTNSAANALGVMNEAPPQNKEAAEAKTSD